MYVKVAGLHHVTADITAAFQSLSQRNCFPSECESHDKIQELLTPKLEKEPWKPIPVTNPV